MIKFYAFVVVVFLYLVVIFPFDCCWWCGGTAAKLCSSNNVGALIINPHNYIWVGACAD